MGVGSTAFTVPAEKQSGLWCIAGHTACIGGQLTCKGKSDGSAQVMVEVTL